MTPTFPMLSMFIVCSCVVCARISTYTLKVVCGRIVSANCASPTSKCVVTGRTNRFSRVASTHPVAGS